MIVPKPPLSGLHSTKGWIRYENKTTLCRSEAAAVGDCLLIGVGAALIWGAGSLGTQRELADRVVRLHVLANSDSEADQALKLKVRDQILKVAEPVLEDSSDREEARGRSVGGFAGAGAGGGGDHCRRRV